MKIAYVQKRLSDSSLKVVEQANQIINEYTSQGFELTLRQLYYQFVSRGLLENTMREYKKLGDIVSNGRLAGLISWEAIVDRTRNLEKNPHWQGPKHFMDSVTPQFQMDKWVGQEYRPEVWIEKDALIGVIERICRQLDVPYFSCRGYTSQSEMWSASQRLIDYQNDGFTPVIIHLGDHDPSGKDMTRDIEDRLRMFCDGDIEVNRIALNMNQVRQYNPPPNPAKITDSRAHGYIKEYGTKSWELDALDPRVLAELIEETITSYRDDETWDAAVATEKKHRASLVKAAKELKS